MLCGWSLRHSTLLNRLERLLPIDMKWNTHEQTQHQYRHYVIFLFDGSIRIVVKVGCYNTLLLLSWVQLAWLFISVYTALALTRVGLDTCLGASDSSDAHAVLEHPAHWRTGLLATSEIRETAAASLSS